MMSPFKAGLVAGLFFPLGIAFATTFGPIPVYKQAENTQYYVHARILTSSRVAMEPNLHRPYTYWDVQVNEQLQGSPLPSQLTIREPGGEVGDMGYHVAGTATFSAGEDVFIALHDTEEENVKEVVGLASGKFIVEPGKDGQPIVRSGLGLPVSGSNGAPLGPEEFSALLHRIARGQATDADKNIFVSRKPMHDDDIPTATQALNAEKPSPARDVEPVADTAHAPSTKTKNGISLAPNPIQQRPLQAEESNTGSTSWGWLIAVGALVGLVLGLFFALR